MAYYIHIALYTVYKNAIFLFFFFTFAKHKYKIGSGGGAMRINDERIKQIITDYENKTELAYKTELSPATLYNIAAGRSTAGRKVLMALVNKLDVDFEELIIREG
jgi:hypothetical protein